MRLALGGELVEEWLKDLPLSPRQGMYLTKVLAEI
jgi:hypothetical protein